MTIKWLSRQGSPLLESPHAANHQQKKIKERRKSHKKLDKQAFLTNDVNVLHEVSIILERREQKTLNCYIKRNNLHPLSYYLRIYYHMLTLRHHRLKNLNC